MLRYQQAMDSGDGSLGRTSEDKFAIFVYSDDLTGQSDGINDIGVVMTFAMSKFTAVTSSGNIIEHFDRERVAPAIWKITANYCSQQKTRPTSDSSFSFSTTGGTQHISTSRETVSSYVNSGTDESDPSFIIPDFKGAINVSDGKSQGVDIFVPNFGFKCTQYAAASEVTGAFVEALYLTTGTVNDDDVTIRCDGVLMTFKSGELLFMGAEGSKRPGYGDWEITQEWAASPNLNGVTIGPFDSVDKNGWDYGWVYYMPQPDPDAKIIVHVPMYMYVERVYPYRNHSPICVNFSTYEPSEIVWSPGIGGALIIPGGGTVGVDGFDS